MIPTSLYTRVLLVVVALFTVAAALTGYLAALVLSDTLDRQYRSKGEAIATTIAGASVDSAKFKFLDAGIRPLNLPRFSVRMLVARRRRQRLARPPAPG